MTNDIPGGPVTFLSAFLIGLGLNLTPCVYPLLAVSVSLFGGKQSAEETRLRRFLKALVYVLGIATMYSASGVLAALSGSFFGAFLQSKWVLVSIALLLIALSLSMFGFYTFQFPSWLLTRLSGERKGNFLGLYASGILAGIFAAPCIGPPIIAILTFVGARGDAFFGFWIFFIMSLGFGLPYLILGTYSDLLKKIPKSGTWMLWVEHLFGVLLLTIAAFYLVIALNPTLLSWLPTAALILGGAYLGFFERSGPSNVRFGWFKKAAGILAIAGGIAIQMAAPKQALAWDTYAPGQLEAAAQAGKPVIIDFYADWCIPCHELDRYTYTDPNVIESLSNFTKIKVDVTDMNDPKANELINRFDVIGVPTVLFLGPGGVEDEKARINGFISPSEFIEIVRSLSFARETIK